MGLDKQGKLDILAAERGPREHELFAAQVELEVKEEGVKHGLTGVTEDVVEEVRKRVDAIKAQIKVIDDHAEKVNLESE